MAALTIHSIDIDGIAITPESAAGGGDTFVNDASERTYLEVINGGGGSINVTFTNNLSSQTVAGYGQVDFSDKVVAVGAGVTKKIGPFPQSQFGATVAVAYSGVTSVTVVAAKLGLP